MSEETGAIRLAERGRLSSPMSDETLREELKARLGKSLSVVARGHRADDPSEPSSPRQPDAGDSIAGMGSGGMHDSIAFKEGPREHL